MQTKIINYLIIILSLLNIYSFAVPPGFNVQGRLTDANGVNRDGNFQITFSIFDVETGGTALWEQSLSVTVKNGNFQAILQGLDKNNKSIEETVKNLDKAYVEITVSGEEPMVPRQPLLRSPFAVADKLTSKSDVIIQSDSQNMGAGSIFIKTGAKDSLTILNNGNVGIGTANPFAVLHLDVIGNNNIRLNSAHNGYFELESYSFSTGVLLGNIKAKSLDGSEITAMTIRENGNVGIGNKSPTQKLHIEGRLVASYPADGEHPLCVDAVTNALAACPSDMRLKKNLEQVANVLGDILKISVYKYNTIDEKDTDQKRYGIIAQEVLPLFPGLVYVIKNPDGNEYYGVNYDRLAVILLEAIKEQQNEIKIFKERLDNAGIK